MATFALALSDIRTGSDHLLIPEHINQLALDENLVFRHTTLSPGNTIKLFVQQIAHGNVACTAMRHLAGIAFTDSAWCQARQRLPVELIQHVHRGIIDQVRNELNAADDVGGEEGCRWRGHRLFALDGSGDSMPDTPQLREHYGVPSGCREGLGFPTSHLLLMMDHRSGLLVDCVDAPMVTSDMALTPPMHRHMEPGDIALADIAFAGGGHLALIVEAKLHAIMPMHHRRTAEFVPRLKSPYARERKAARNKGKPHSAILRKLGHDDQLVVHFKPPQKPAWMDDETWTKLPQTITLREIRRTVKRKGYRPLTVCIVTTLLDPQAYPADELIELRLSRWLIETNLRHLKITLGMDVLKCKTLAGVRKERLIFLLVYNLIRIIMLRAARRQGVNVNRLSFADTLAWIRHGDLRQYPALIVNPLRPGRLEPRVIKRQKKEFPYMTKPRAVLKAQLYEKYGDMS